MYQNEDWCQTNNCCADITVETKNISLETKTEIIRNNNQIVLNFPDTFSGEANIELYTIGGVLIDKAQAYQSYSRDLDKGVYIIRVNGQVIKLVK